MDAVHLVGDAGIGDVGQQQQRNGKPERILHRLGARHAQAAPFNQAPQRKARVQDQRGVKQHFAHRIAGHKLAQVLSLVQPDGRKQAQPDVQEMQQRIEHQRKTTDDAGTGCPVAAPQIGHALLLDCAHNGLRAGPASTGRCGVTPLDR